MRRHSSLRDLSSDHHTALVQAHRLKRVATTNAATQQTIIADFLTFWHDHGQRHFCEEEQALLPYFACWGDLNQEPIHQMLREHALIRRDAMLLQNGDRSEALCQKLGEQLEAHVRLEERVIFPLIEAALPEDALLALPAALEAWHNEKPVSHTRPEAKDKTMSTTLQATPATTEGGDSEHALPGSNLQTHKMPGHWLLARLGKKVLRPGGLELTRHLLQALNIQPYDHVVEFAPGLGITAQMTLAREPASYIAIERDEAAANNVRQLLSGPGREVRIGSADDTGLPDACASIVYGEAMLTMQTPDTKERIVREAARLLRPGGSYGIHEICLVPDDISAETEQEIMQALSGSIRVGARPLRIRDWRALLDAAGLEVKTEHRVPMELLDLPRIVADEGLSGTLQIVWNALHDAEALARVREMRAVFHKYHNHLEAIALVGVKK